MPTSVTLTIGAPGKERAKTQHRPTSKTKGKQKNLHPHEKPTGEGKEENGTPRILTRQEQRKKKINRKGRNMPEKEKTFINMEDGLRTLNTASLNPASTKEEKIQGGIIKSLARNKIHISAIQETHISQGRSYVLGNYRIITAAGKNETRGVVVRGGT